MSEQMNTACASFDWVQPPEGQREPKLISWYYWFNPPCPTKATIVLKGHMSGVFGW